MKYVHNGFWLITLLISLIFSCCGMQKNSTIQHKVVYSRELVLDFKGDVIHSQDISGNILITATSVSNLTSVLLNETNKGLFGFCILEYRDTDPSFLRAQFTNAKVLSLSANNIRRNLKYFEVYNLQEDNTVTLEAHGDTSLKVFIGNLNENPQRLEKE